MTALPAPRERAIAAGKAAFGPDWSPTAIATAPGRIELIGNHVDYNGGPVLAAAIDRVLTIAIGDRDMDGIGVTFPDASADTSADVATLELDGLRGWEKRGPIEPADYVRGVIAAALGRDVPVRAALTLSVAGDVPLGAGLSSSAALCVALTFALVEVDLPFAERVLLAQEAEHRAGTPCGTMDQAASLAGGIIRFAGGPDKVEQLGAELGEHVFVVVGSGVQRSLATSSYRTRVEESERARRLAEAALDRELPSLAAVRPDDLPLLERDGLFSGKGTLLKRVRHVATEVDRVGRAEAALHAGNWVEFGSLMRASGWSSARNYEISHSTVEAIVQLLNDQPGVLGARMMGGGEGGTLLALMQTDALSEIEAALAGSGLTPPRTSSDWLFLPCRFAPGASIARLA